MRGDRGPLRQRFKRAEVRLYHARAAAQATFWLSFGFIVAESNVKGSLRWMAVYGILGITAAILESRITPRLRRLTRALAGRWGLSCFNGSESFTMRFRGPAIVRTPVEATHVHGPWMLLQGEMISMDVDREKVELGKRYVVSLRAVGSADSTPNLPTKQE